MTTDATPGNVPLSDLLGNEFGWLAARIDTEMAEYWDGAYVDSSCAKDQLERFAAEVQAPLLARIRELTLYAAGVEAERENAREEARQNFVRAREWAERCGAAESQRDEALADAVRAYTKLNGLHVSAKAHRDRVRELVAARQPLSDETIARLMPEPTVRSANVVRWDSRCMHKFARAIEAEHGISL